VDFQRSWAPGLVVSTNERLLLLCGHGVPSVENTLSATRYLTISGGRCVIRSSRAERQSIRPYRRHAHRSLVLVAHANEAAMVAQMPTHTRIGCDAMPSPDREIDIPLFG
jgi:hypothetical protein